jgi:hypothetical protein
MSGITARPRTREVQCPAEKSRELRIDRTGQGLGLAALLLPRCGGERMVSFRFSKLVRVT